MDDMTATHTRKVLETLQQDVAWDKDLERETVIHAWRFEELIQALISDYEAIKECTCNKE